MINKEINNNEETTTNLDLTQDQQKKRKTRKYYGWTGDRTRTFPTAPIRLANAGQAIYAALPSSSLKKELFGRGHSKAGLH